MLEDVNYATNMVSAGNIKYESSARVRLAGKRRIADTS